MKRLLSAISLCAFLLVQQSCVIDDRGRGGSGAIELENDSAYTVRYFYVVPSGSATWGYDQLRSDVVYPGESFLLTGLRCNRSYDLLAETQPNVVLAELYDVYVRCGETVVWSLY